MIRQASAKQTSAQTQAREPNKQMVESAKRRLLSKQEKKSSSSSNSNNAKNNVDSNVKEVNIQPTNLVRIKIHSVCLHCHKYPKHYKQKR